MNAEKMKAVAEKAYRVWMKENGSPEATAAWIREKLEGARRELMLAAFGMERDVFDNTYRLRDYGPTPILRALTMLAQEQAPKWVADIFAGGLPPPSEKIARQVNRAYLAALAEEMEKLACQRAQSDAQGLLDSLLQPRDAAGE